MRRFLFLALVAASLLPGPVRAQATADQLNKLSLEALTARPAGGGSGYTGRAYRPSYRRAYRPRSYRRARYAHRSYARLRFYAHPAFHGRSYAGHGHRAGRYFAPVAHRRVAPIHRR